MSDDEYENTSNTSKTSKKGDEAFAKAKSGIKQGELNEQLKEYIGEWRNQRAKEEEELKRLKDKQAKRKEIRAEQDKKLAAEKKQEEDRVKKEAADKKAAEDDMKKQEMHKYGPPNPPPHPAPQLDVILVLPVQSIHAIPFSDFPPSYCER